MKIFPVLIYTSLFFLKFYLYHIIISTMKHFDHINTGIIHLVTQWEPILQDLPEKLITIRKNNQQRTIKQIVGHMIDSASNNRHRVIYLQYEKSPLHYPNYATYGNNDRWIAIQDYQHANWNNLVQLWKYANIHFAHIINNVDVTKLKNVWHYSEDRTYSLEEMVIDYLKHLKLHLNEIDELIQAD